jgi:hypothetical protein
MDREVFPFPEYQNEVPEEFQTWDVEQEYYLDGTIKKHDGAFQKVYSPILMDHRGNQSILDSIR